MQGAVYKAFYGLETAAVFNCSSNCTWGHSYVSLGFSSTCQNVTQTTYATQSCITNETNGGRNCTMTTPGNVTFTIAEVPTDWDTALVIRAKAMYAPGDQYKGHTDNASVCLFEFSTLDIIQCFPSTLLDALISVGAPWDL